MSKSYLRGLFMISVLTVGGGRTGGGLDTGGIWWFFWLLVDAADTDDDGLDNDDDDEGCDLDVWGEAGRFMFPLPGPRPE